MFLEAIERLTPACIFILIYFFNDCLTMVRLPPTLSKQALRYYNLSTLILSVIGRLLPPDRHTIMSSRYG